MYQHKVLFIWYAFKFLHFVVIIIHASNNLNYFKNQNDKWKLIKLKKK